MRSLVTALLLGSALWSPALAADTALITVTGEGSVEAKPDMATINLGVTTEGTTAAEAMAANSVQLGAVLEQLRAAGIEDRDLQTSGLSLSPNWQQPQYVSGTSSPWALCLTVLFRTGPIPSTASPSGWQTRFRH
jgi:uncharacterized protein YggE